MAFKFSFTDEFGIANPAAYVVVRHFMVDFPPGVVPAIISCDAHIYASQAAFTAGKKAHIKSYSYLPTLAVAISANVALAYNYLKSLPEFAGAQDV